MSAVTGNAMRMKLELAALMQKHGYAVEPHFIKSTAPVDYPLDVSGLASTTDIDLGRQKFRGWAFDNLCLTLKGYPLPKLLYKHDDDQIAGRITSLGYDDKGRLRISAEVTHPLAKLCSAFSVGAKLNTYEIKDADNTNFHALITSAEITEISLTDCPANPQALVQIRSRAVPLQPYLKSLHEHTDLQIKAVSTIQQRIAVLRAALAAQAPVSAARRPVAPRPAVRRQPMITRVRIASVSSAR